MMTKILNKEICMALLLVMLTSLFGCSPKDAQSYPQNNAEKDAEIANKVAEEIKDEPIVEVDEKQQVMFKDGNKMFAFRIPNVNENGDKVTEIAADAFRGNEFFSTIYIPIEITTIGDHAFDECPNLKYIILEDRDSTDGMTLGESWNGESLVIYGKLVVVIDDSKDNLPNKESIANLNEDDTSDIQLDSMDVNDSDFEIGNESEGRTVAEKSQSS